MASWVTMVHPETEAEIKVLQESVRVWVKQGWEVVHDDFDEENPFPAMAGFATTVPTASWETEESDEDDEENFGNSDFQNDD